MKSNAIIKSPNRQLQSKSYIIQDTKYTYIMSPDNVPSVTVRQPQIINPPPPHSAHHWLTYQLGSNL